MAHKSHEHSLNGKTSAALAEQYAQRALRGAPTLTTTEAQVLWALCGKITRSAQNAEHAAFMLLSEIQTEQGSGAEFRAGVLRELGEVADQMRAVKALIDGGIEALKKREGVAA